MESFDSNSDLLNQLMADVPDKTLSDYADLDLEDDNSDYLDVVRRLGHLATN